MILCLCLSACASYTPSSSYNVCKIFKEKPRWKKAAVRSQKKWGGSTAIAMAIMFQESSFKAKAKPPMRYFFGVIPKGRASDAYGYAQALKSTWADYQRAVGSRFKKRDRYADAIDFIHWYMSNSDKRNQVTAQDAFAHYLNYHEGHSGYARSSYRNKSWLIQIAGKVSERARRYQNQLNQCPI